MACRMYLSPSGGYEPATQSVGDALITTQSHRYAPGPTVVYLPFQWLATRQLFEPPSVLQQLDELAEYLR